MYKDLSLQIRFGDQGSGKSLIGAIDMERCLNSYVKNQKRFPQMHQRILFSGEKLNQKLEAEHLGKRLFYWSSARQLKYCPRPDCWRKYTAEELTKAFGLEYEHQNNPELRHPVHDADIYWPEISKDFGSDSSKETPPWLKQIFSHCRKRRNNIVADAQTYEDVNIAFRRNLRHAFLVYKVRGSRDIQSDIPDPLPWTIKNFLRYMIHFVTFKKLFWHPGVIWGKIEEYEFDPKALEWEKDPERRLQMIEESKAGYRGFFIRKKYIDIYDTAHELPPYKSNSLEHVEFWCENENCDKHGRRSPTATPKVEHYKL